MWKEREALQTRDRPSSGGGRGGGAARVWDRESWLKLEKAKGGLEVPSGQFPVCEAAGAWEGGVTSSPDWEASLCHQYLINKITLIILEAFVAPAYLPPVLSDMRAWAVYLRLKTL